MLLEVFGVLILPKKQVCGGVASFCELLAIFDSKPCYFGPFRLYFYGF